MVLTSVIAILALAVQAEPIPESDVDVPVEQAGTQETASPVEEPTLASGADKEASPDEKVICKRTAVTGSKFKKKVCGTKKQWEMMANSSSRAARDIQRRNRSTGSPQ